FAEPYFLGNRLSAGVDLFASQLLQSPYASFGSETYGAGLHVGLPLNENMSVQARYNIQDQKITLNSLFSDCNAFTTAQGLLNVANGCLLDGEASAAFKFLATQGFVLISSVGYTFDYSTLDNVRNPTAGLFASVKQDLAGVGGAVNYIKTTGDARYYYNVY